MERSEVILWSKIYQNHSKLAAKFQSLSKLFFFCNLNFLCSWSCCRIYLAVKMRPVRLASSYECPQCRSSCLRVLSIMDLPERYSPSSICPLANWIIFSQACRATPAVSVDANIVIIIFYQLLILPTTPQLQSIIFHSLPISCSSRTVISFFMIKAFQVILKVGTVPVFSLPHIGESILTKVESCKKFRDYVEKFNSLEPGTNVSKIEILCVEMFGDKVGFVSMRAFTEKDGYKLPAYVFLRGPAVAILMFVNNKLLLVEQYRVSIQSTLLQAPAGMIDQSGDFVGVAAAEIEEETSIKIRKEDLKPLGSYYPSPGGCDEEIFMYYCHVNVPAEQMKVIEEKIHGKEGESERIRVRLVDYDSEIVTRSKDSKLVYLAYAYENMLRRQQKSSSL